MSTHNLQESINFYHAINDVLCKWGETDFCEYNNIIENVSKKYHINKDELNKKISSISLYK